MLESLITAFIVYLVVSNPIGDSPIFGHHIGYGAIKRQHWQPEFILVGTGRSGRGGGYYRGYSDCHQSCRGLQRRARDIGVFPHHRNYSGGHINSVYY